MQEHKESFYEKLSEYEKKITRNIQNRSGQVVQYDNGSHQKISNLSETWPLIPCSLESDDLCNRNTSIATMGMIYSKVRPDHSVLPTHMTGGPMGLGDPNDNTLRKIEEDVVIPEKLRKISRQKKCPDLVKAFSKCGEDAGLLISIKCEDERKALVDCLVKWFHDKDLKEEVTKEYLRERAIYRQTGMNVEQQEHLEGIRKKAREKFWEDYEKKKQEKLESENKENT